MQEPLKGTVALSKNVRTQKSVELQYMISGK